MTAKMPRTKPNIMMTARLLLRPVFKSVELKVVLCAKAGRTLSASKAATVNMERIRARTFFGTNSFFIVSVFYFRGGFFRRIVGQHLIFQRALCVTRYTT